MSRPDGEGRAAYRFPGLPAELPECMVGVVLMLGRFGKAVRHAAKSPEFRGLAVAAVIMIASGTIVYTLLEHWSVVDAFYFAVSVLTTTTPTGLVLTHTITKLFTAIYVLLGITIILEFARSIAYAYGDLRISARERRHADK